MFAGNVYRAATQSITADEAFTYNDFLDGGVEKLFNNFDAAHHVLHTILCRIAVSLFGLSEFTLRLPSLLGGLLYLVTALRISRMAFGSGWFSTLAFALLTTSPAVLDYMSAARGYGLALAFFLWALVQACESRLLRCGAGLALAVAANLTLVFPGLALAAIVTWRLAREGRTGEALDRFLLPGLLLAFSIVILPLTHATKDHFYFGSKTLGGSVASVAAIGWSHNGSAPEGLAWAVPFVLALAIPLCFRAKDRTLLPLAAGSLAGSFLLLLSAARLFQVLYPLRRTGLYWIPLFLLTALLVTREIWNSRFRWAAAPLLAAAILTQAQFASELGATHYSEWAGDASTRRVISAIRRHHDAHPKPSAAVGAATWALEPGLNFYRRLFRLDWMQPVDREHVPGRDYYVALPEDWRKLDSFARTIIYQDSETEVRVAIP